MALERLRGFESKSFLLASGDFRSSSNGNVHDLTATYRTQVIKLKEAIRRKWLTRVRDCRSQRPCDYFALRFSLDR